MADEDLPEIDLRKYLARLHKCQESLCKIGFVLTGSIVKRYMPCGSANCSCRTDPKKLHGPYYEWTRKVRGKTVSVRLTEKQAELFQEWIENKRRFYAIVSEIEQITLEAVELIRG